MSPNADPREAGVNPLRARLRPPPDYYARGTRVRIFALLAALLVVATIAERSRDPASWNWLFNLSSDTEREKPITNRLPLNAGRPLGEDGEVIVVGPDRRLPLVKKPVEAVPPAGDQEPSEIEKSTKPEEFDPVARSWNESWKEVWRQLGSEEKSLLYRMLEACHDDKQLPSAEAAAAANLIKTIDKYWSVYHSAAFQEVAKLQGTDQAIWVDVLRQVNSRWSGEVKSSLEGNLAGRPATEIEQKILSRFQADLNALNLALIKDDAAFLRPDEKQIWFYLLHELQTGTPAKLQRSSVGEVGYASLYNQPENYRGQVVTLRATVKWAYRVQATDNHLGIKEYFVYWLLPSGTMDTPVVVYALETPPGFPALKDRDRDSGMTKLHEEVTFTGYFYKRGAYRGQDGIYTVPLILARGPEWTPTVSTIGQTEANGSWVLSYSAGVALLLTGVTAVVIYFSSFRRRRSLAAQEILAHSSPDGFKGLEIGPSVSDTLKQLQQQERTDAS